MDDYQTDDGPDDDGQADAGAQSGPVDPAQGDPAQSDGLSAQYLQDINNKLTADIPLSVPLSISSFPKDSPLAIGGMPTNYYGNAFNVMPASAFDATFNQIPDQVRQGLVNSGTQWDVVPHSVADAYGPSGPDGQPPRNYPPGSTWRDVAGANIGNHIMVPADGQGDSSSGNTVLHEIGHAYNLALGGQLGVPLASDSQGFQDAYNADKDQFDRDGASTNNYYDISRDPQGSRDEAYAEAFANFYGGNQKWQDQHPNVNQWIENFDND